MPPRLFIRWLWPVWLVLILSSGLFGQEDPSPTPVAPEADVSAFSNDGYKIRDGYWPGEIEPNRPQFLEVNLFAGNEYWFSAAVNPPGRKIALSVFNEMGKPTDFQTYEDGQVAAAGFVPEVSGRYYVKLTLLDGEKAQFCLLYSYK